MLNSLRMNADFFGMSIPEHVRGGLLRYASEHVQTGDFLRAVISNDLREAVARADDENMRNIPAIVNWLYWEAPSECWGSPEKYQEWISP